MPIDVTMPRLSDTMESGTVVRWHVKEGDPVTSGAVVADIETDKATMEMQVFDDGTIAKILVPEGQAVSVGTKIAEIAGDDDGGAGASGSEQSNAGSVTPPSATSERTNSATTAASSERMGAPQQAAGASQAVQSGAPSDRSAAQDSRRSAEGVAPMRVSPVARRMAEEFGVDLSQVRGSGPGGRIIKRDIEAAAETAGARVPSREGPLEDRSRAGLASPAPASASRSADRGSLATPVGQGGARSGGALAVSGLQSVEMPLSSMRQTIAKRLVESKQSIPHYQVSMAFAMDALVALRSSLNADLEKSGVKLSVNDFVVRAAALAMARHPFFNASWGGDHLVVHQTVNIGVAVALDEERGGGLLVATIRDADRKSLRQISLEAKALSEKARTKGLSLEEMSDSTFTISNLGMFGVDHFTAIINPPNSAILACGAALQKPVVRDGALAVGWEMTATLSLDHRVIDGAMAARFLQTIRHFFEHPTLLLV
ncbi:MAG: 2-oxo acid dehydrogenase subunit E2 [Phycisphaeraceae bacterium]|nr:2-oxo acid dehydrogenase subunit E2 [Phycisphaeraceae bacterium]